ncbi:MAG: adenosine deaminase, partial [Chloroflexota bacterium]
YDRELADMSLEELRPHVQMVPGQALSSDVFLSKFRTLRQFYNSPETIQRITREVVIDAALDNIKYMELRFTPRALCNVIGCEYPHVMNWVCDTVAETAARYDIEVRLLVSMNRHEGEQIGNEVLDMALRYRDRGVVGIDLAGQEKGYSAKPFAPIFLRAKAEGLQTTAHAGEWMGAQSVLECVEQLQVNRIGHGIRAVEDNTIVAILADRGIILETCPTSNLHSGVVKDLEQHPLIDLHNAGVRTTINTDDPLISNVTLTTELLDVMFTMKLSLDDIKQQTLNAMEGAFLPDDERNAMVEKFNVWLEDVIHTQETDD